MDQLECTAYIMEYGETSLDNEFIRMKMCTKVLWLIKLNGHEVTVLNKTKDVL